MTLTAAKDLEVKDLRRALAVWIQQLRLVQPDLEHWSVVERGSTRTKRRHLHVILRGMPYWDYSFLRERWKSALKYRAVLTKWIHAEPVKSRIGASTYLAKYLHKSVRDRLTKRPATWSRGFFKNDCPCGTSFELHRWRDEGPPKYLRWWNFADFLTDCAH